MSIVDEISSAMRKGPELINKTNQIKINRKSVAKGARDSTFQFPCLIDKSIEVSMANTVARTLERVYAAWTQTWLSMNSMIDITVDPTPLSYLKRMHQNMAIEAASDAIEDLTLDESEIATYEQRLYDGSCRLYMTEDKKYGVFFNLADPGVGNLMKSNKELLKEHMSDFDLKPVDIYTEALSDGTTVGDMANAILDGTRQQRDDERRLADLKATSLAQRSSPKLTDRDIKRSNDLVPFGIEVRLLAVNDKKEFVQYIDFIIGIKTVLHLIDTDDMIDNIVRALQNKNVMFKLLRWTTGEISLAKDIILNLNNIRQDATANGRNNKSPFFASLKKLKNRKLGIHSLTVPHAIIPNATIVISIDQVLEIKDKYGIDLKDAKTAERLIDALFLMGFIILDEGTDTMMAMYDSDKSFHTYSMDTLQRENTLSSNKLGNEIGRMISK